MSKQLFSFVDFLQRRITSRIIMKVNHLNFLFLIVFHLFLLTQFKPAHFFFIDQ